MVEHSVTISGVTKTYRNGVQALRGVDLEIGRGMFGLLGPNGAGKTTLMRIVASLLKPTSGSVTLMGVDVVANPRRVRASLGFLPQEFGLYPRLTASEHLRYFCDLKNVEVRAVNAEVSRLLAATGLTDVARRRAATLSGGMKQRLGVAIALIGSPRLIVVDEPTVGLDPEERVRFRTMLSEIAADTIVILSTHIVQDIEIGCSRAAVIADGRVMLCDTPNGLTALAQGHVWDARIKRWQIDDLKRDYSIISMRELGDGIIDVRIAGDTPPATAECTLVRPQLEDAYLFLLRNATSGAAMAESAVAR